MTADQARPQRIGAGRPPFFETPEEMDSRINLYFAECDDKKEPYTVESLAYYLGFSARNQLWEIASRRSDFADTIARARLKIASNRMIGGLNGSQKEKIVIFDFINNHEGYRDTKDISLQGQIEHAPGPHMIGSGLEQALIGSAPIPEAETEVNEK